MYDTIAQILQQRIGLMPDSIGIRTLTRVVDQCIADLQLRNPQDYLQRLRSDETVLQSLIEAIIVPETWFMRDRAPFDFLQSQVQLNPSSSSRLLSSQRPLRILSLPCSTGEEPYSIAMSLLDAGLKPTEFSVDGIDISHASLQRARTARYGSYAFRNQTPDIRDRYFDPDGQSYQLQKQVCDRVTFIQGNILERTWINTLRPYHVIFCRNLLIYLNAESRRQVFANLDSVLAADGILFLGSTESTQSVPPPLHPLRHEGTFLYRKQITSSSRSLSPSTSPPSSPSTSRFASQSANQSTRTDPVSRTATHQDVLPVPELSAGRLSSLRSDISPPKSQPPLSRVAPNPNPASRGESTPAQPRRSETLPTPSELSGLRQLADAGLLDEAIESCEYYLRGHSSDAEGHLLLGELYQAQQLNSRAEECYRRATYLDPANRQALIHLALLKEQQGDNSGANLFWRRVDRLGREST